VRRGLAGAILAGTVALALPCAAQELRVPQKYQLLYDGLDRQVSAFQARLPPATPQRHLRRAALLASMRCEAGPDLQSATRWGAAMLELDALRRVGTQVVVLEACYPLLTPAFQDPRPLLEHLANLANQVRLRDMAILVDHRILPATNPSVQAARHYQRMTRPRFVREHAEEAKALVIALQPDYLTLVSDPQAPAAGLRLTARQWRAHLDALTRRFHAELGDFVPALGAGSGVWGEPAFVDAFAAVPGLAYIDLRFYPVIAGQESTLERVLAWPDRIRAIDPAKRVVLSQVWLSKANSKEPQDGRTDANVLAREAFNFWAALDAKFLRALAHGARVKDIELVGVSRPRHLFAYLDFFDPTTFRASARLLDELATQRAAAAMQQGGLTETGRAFGGL
jgi:hypothetical protein